MSGPPDLPSLREAYIAEYSRYEKLCTAVSTRLKSLCAEAEITADVSGRPKDVPSFLKKAWREPGKYTDPIAEITDKAGVRVVVAGLGDVKAVEAIVESEFDLAAEKEDKLDQLKPDQLGYLGIHYLIRLLPASLADAEVDLNGMICEVQIHTKAQSAWATVNHPLTYKPIGDVPPAVSRRIMRAVALVSLFDDEVEAAKGELMAQPGYRHSALLDVLDRYFTMLGTTVSYDYHLSMRVLEVIGPSYTDAECERFGELVATYVDSNQARLSEIYSRDGVDPYLEIMASQPELIAICERLDNAKLALRQAWCSVLAFDLLEEVASAVGRPY
jgi:ppGpp synthetase/RelA/SpoT-type nucleotidyltranferase